jgi:hypothetical protein
MFGMFGAKEPSMRFFVRALVAILMLMALASAVDAPPALAAGTPTTIVLPIDRVAELELDEANGHLFISAGPGGSEVLVTDLRGTEVRRIGGLPGASGLLLIGGTLYVALHDAHAIAAVDTASLSETRRFDLPDLPGEFCPDELASTAGRVVYTAPHCNRSFHEARLGVLDPATGESWNDHTVSSTPTIAANQASDGVVAVASTASSPTNVVLYDIRGGTAELLRATTEPQGVRAMTMSPDGRSLFASARFLPLDTMTWSRVIPGATVGIWSGDGSRLVTGEGALLSVWPAGSTATISGVRAEFGVAAGPRLLAADATAARGWVVNGGTFPTDPILLTIYDLTPNGTAWTLSAARTEVPEWTAVTLTAKLSVGGAPVPDGERLVVLVTRPDGTTVGEEHFTRDGGVSLSRLAARGVTRYTFSWSDPVNGSALAYADVIGTFKTRFTVTVEPTSPANPGQRLTWFGRLTDDVGRSLPSELVELLRDGTTVDVAGTDFQGFFQLTDEPQQTGTFHYILRWPGTEAGAPAEHETVVTVERSQSFVNITAVRGTGRNGRTATVTAFLSEWRTNRSVTVTAQPAGGTPTVIAQGEVAEDTHTLTTTYRLRRDTTFTVTYDGDEWFTPAEASTLLTLR